jgi:capsular exopolysaccharide synthesis family protein
MMSGLDHSRKIILVTSSVPDEGKTTVAMNMAFAFGQIRKVCLIDADMRRPSVGRVLGMSSSTPGLSNLIAGTEPPEKCIHLDKETGVHIIPGGAQHPNPQELLASKRFSEVMKKLHEMFEMIIIDSPPVQLMSDSLILSSHVNSLIYVVKADSTPYQVASSGIERLQKVGAPIAGVVLNQLDLRKADKYYGYGKYSAYGRYSYYKKGYSEYGYSAKA